MKRLIILLLLSSTILFFGCTDKLIQENLTNKTIIKINDKIISTTDIELINKIKDITKSTLSNKSISSVGFIEDISIYEYQDDIYLNSYLINNSYLYSKNKTYSINSKDYNELLSLIDPYLNKASLVLPDYIPSVESSFAKIPLEDSIVGEYAAALYFTSKNEEDKQHSYFKFTKTNIIQGKESFPYSIVDKTENALLLNVFETDKKTNILFQIKIRSDKNKKALYYEKVFDSIGPEQYFPEKIVRLCDKGPIPSYLQFNNPFFFDL